MSAYDAFERALTATLKNEGGYVYDPADPGGITNLGVTEATARSAGYEGDMKDLTHEQAKGIYERLYWDTRRLPCPQIAQWYVPAAIEAFDSAVLAGVRRSATWVQECVNALNKNEKLFFDLKVDGYAGSNTMSALKHLDMVVDKKVFVIMLNAKLACHLFSIMDSNPILERFARGWFLKRVG